MEMWIWRRMEEISWEDKISNQEVLQRVNDTTTMLDTVRKRKHVWLGHVLRHVVRDVIEGRMRRKATRDRQRMHLLSDLMKRKYVALKRTDENGKEWQKLLRAGSHTPGSQQIT